VAAPSEGDILVRLACGSTLTGLPPIPLRDWNRFEHELERVGLTPGALVEQVHHLTIPSAVSQRLALLDRVEVAATRLAGEGIWSTTRGSPEYPASLCQHLDGGAPLVLFGSGPVEKLAAASRPAVAVVGTRTLTPGIERWAGSIGSACATAGLTVASGWAYGVDRTAMLAALGHAGASVGVLPDSLHAAQLQPRPSGLVLLAPSDPDCPFSTASALGRNRLIYALGAFAIVVSCHLGSGGTWHGASDWLRNKATPLHVAIAPDLPDDNRGLLSLGALALTARPDVAVLSSLLASSERSESASQPALF
jgi:predicted Rossmann fold nucleotide-binding protein DprA/Smf involved in DNA uptake